MLAVARAHRKKSLFFSGFCASARYLFSALSAWLALGVTAVRAEILEAPVGGHAFSLGEARVACSSGGAGFVVEPGGRTIRPPTRPEAVGDSIELKVARNAVECASSTRTVTLLAIDTWPTFEPGSVVFWPDDGRIEAAGQELAGVSVLWQSSASAGGDVCRAPERGTLHEHCVWGTERDLSADTSVTTFSFLPRGARAGGDVVLFDAHGRRVKPEQLVLVPARVHISSLTRPDAAIDLSTGQGEVPLVHPEAVSSADCGALSCEMQAGKLVVRGATSLVPALEIRLRLAPHVFAQRKNSLETQVTLKFPVLHCPLSIVSGAPVRGNDDAKIVVKLEGGCARDLSSVTFMGDDGPLKVLRTVNEEESTYVLLRLGDFGGDSLNITAQRGDDEPIVLAVAHTPTRIAPVATASLELPGFPNLNFIPNNRAAVVHISPPGEHQRFAVLPIPGVYDVFSGTNGESTIQGNRNAAGLTVLSFGLRAEGLPGGLDEVNLAVVSDALQRSVHEANVPVSFITASEPKHALIEVLCGGGEHTPPIRLTPEETAHLDFELRDTCRVIFHRERLSAESGTQKLHFEIDIVRADGTSRGEAHVTETLTFRPGSEPRYAWVHGVMESFDRVIVRVSHEADEQHYMGADEIRTGAPGIQWTAVMGTGRARLYGTTTIPTGLYRFGDKDHSGVLSLNFGVISRLTWLDKEGKEGFLGAEAGVLVIGLANSTSATGKPLTQIGAVVGLGVAVPIANRSTVSQASINLHAWLEANLTGGANSGSRYAFIFGPSISIGNVGTNL